MLKFKIGKDDYDSLDDAVKSHYSETDNGDYTLSVEGVKSDDEIQGLTGALQKERDQVSDLKAELRLWKKLGESPAEVTENIRSLEAANNANPDEKDNMITQLKEQLENQKTTFATERANIEQARDAAVSKANNAMISSIFTSALNEAGFTKTGVDLLGKTQLNRFKPLEDGSYEILTPDLKSTMVGSGEGARATIDDLVKELAGDYKDLVRSNRVGGGGSPPSPGRSSSGNTIKRSEFSQMTPAQKAKVMSDGVKLVDD